MTSPTPRKYNDPRSLKSLDQHATSPKSNLKMYLKHDKEETKFSVVDKSLLNYIKPNFPTPPENLRLRGGLAGHPGFPNHVTIIINIPPIVPNQNQQEGEEGEARGLNLGLFKQGTDLIKSVKDEKALAQEAYGTAKEMFHSGIPKFNADTMGQGYHLFENVKQQKDKIHDVVGNVQQISDSLGIDIKGDPREAVEKLKKGYETYSAVKKLQSEPFNAGNLLASGGALFKNLGVGSRSAHISDLPLQDGDNISCPPCPSRRGVGSRSAHISDFSSLRELYLRQEAMQQMPYNRFKYIEELLQRLKSAVNEEILSCAVTFAEDARNPKMSPEEFAALKANINRCDDRLGFIREHISQILEYLK